ncbi:MAG: hypothetical protein KQI78_25295 [Deltaproteobacteria bacterium]|nr:hypothetical protein [Deltaproteobacteria bacterium]
MNKSEISAFYHEYKDRQKEFNEAIDLLKSLNILELSNKQFDAINSKLRLLSKEKRNFVMNDAFKKTIYFKLQQEGYRSQEIRNICSQITKNWNLIIDNSQSVSMVDLVENAIKCWERKEAYLKELVKEDRENNIKSKKKIVGTLRLLAAGGIFAYDASMFATNPTDKIFLASFWASAAIFFQGSDDFFVC